MLVNSPELLPKLELRPVLKRIASFVLALHMPNSGYSSDHHHLPTLHEQIHEAFIQEQLSLDMGDDLFNRSFKVPDEY